MLASRLNGLWPNITQGLWFVPGLVVVAYAALAIALVEVDRRVDFTGVEIVFKGDSSAARTVLSVLAGSLITVAGLTFSTTIVALQLASSQFSPQVIRTFSGDRLTQITVGSYVGIFVYSILVLRSVGDFKEGIDFVPRLSITGASVLGIAAVVLLIVFIHHISQMIQVTHITATIAAQTIERLDDLYPDPYGEPVEGEGDEVLADWRRAAAPGRVFATRSGFVQRVGLDDLFKDLKDPPTRLALLVQPGDFVSPDTPLAEIWPEQATDRLSKAIRDVVAIANVRDLGQDVAFGLRQLSDIARRALSPGINDPTTAVTCISYIRSIVVRLAAKSLPSPTRNVPEGDGEAVFVSRRSFGDYLVSFVEIGRYANGDAQVATALLKALEAVALAAVAAGARDRAAAILTIAEAVGGLAVREAKMELDRLAVEQFLAGVRRAAGPA